jgi:hypothetical protein
MTEPGRDVFGRGGRGTPQYDIGVDSHVPVRLPLMSGRERRLGMLRGLAYLVESTVVVIVVHVDRASEEDVRSVIDGRDDIHGGGGVVTSAAVPIRPTLGPDAVVIEDDCDG